MAASSSSSSSVPDLVARVSHSPLPLVQPWLDPDGDEAPWPHCSKDTCPGSRNERACPLLTQYRCQKCARVLAYLTHGLRADVRRRFYGETRVMHLWPNMCDGSRLLCTKCFRSEYPGTEAALGHSLEEAWRRRRDFDHICEEVDIGENPDT